MRKLSKTSCNEISSRQATLAAELCMLFETADIGHDLEMELLDRVRTIVKQVQAKAELKNPEISLLAAEVCETFLSAVVEYIKLNLSDALKQALQSKLDGKSVFDAWKAGQLLRAGGGHRQAMAVGEFLHTAGTDSISDSTVLKSLEPTFRALDGFRSRQWTQGIVNKGIHQLLWGIL